MEIQNKIREDIKIFMNKKEITNEVIEINDSNIFYIQNINIDYDINENIIYSLYIDGYLFTK